MKVEKRETTLLPLLTTHLFKKILKTVFLGAQKVIVSM